MNVREESEKVGLKLHIPKMMITTSSPIISWKIDGEKVETVTEFIFLGSKITMDGDCSQEIKRCLLLGRKDIKNSTVLCHFSRVQLFATPWTVAHQVPLSTGFFRKEYESGLPCPSAIKNLDNILKSKAITLLTNVHILKAMAFPVVMYRCESWTIKKAECHKIDAFELWC